jgi:hypothetical protein
MQSIECVSSPLYYRDGKIGGMMVARRRNGEPVDNVIKEFPHKHHVVSLCPF